VTTLAGSAGFAGATDGTGTAATFHTPAGMTTDGQNLYVVDSGNLSIRRMDLVTGAVTTVAGGSQGSADGTGPAARSSLSPSA
jgi:hypothetical protein